MNDKYTSESDVQELLRLSKLPAPLHVAELLEQQMQTPIHGRAADMLRTMYAELARVNARLAEQPDRQALQSAGTHPAPCARHCEAQAFEIAARGMRRQIAELQAALAEQPAPVPPAHKPLTDEQIFAMAEAVWRHGWASCRDAEYVGEEAEDERWGEIGAEVVQNIAASGITKGNT